MEPSNTLCQYCAAIPFEELSNGRNVANTTKKNSLWDCRLVSREVLKGAHFADSSWIVRSPFGTRAFYGKKTGKSLLTGRPISLQEGVQASRFMIYSINSWPWCLPLGSPCNIPIWLMQSTAKSTFPESRTGSRIAATITATVFYLSAQPLISKISF